MKRSVRPGDDFFAYADGAWVESAEIPPDRSNWGIGAMLTEVANRRIRAIIQDAAKAPAAKGSDERLIGDFYTAFMDEAGIEARGLEPLRRRLGRLDAITDRRALSEALGRTLRADVDPLNNTNLHTPRLFGLWVAQDLNQPDRNAPYLLQGGLGMPDREYYLDAAPWMAGLRERHREHVARVLRLAGIEDPERKADLVSQLERAIAETHESRAASQDVMRANNPWSRDDFCDRAPGLDWDAFFAAALLEPDRKVIVWQPRAIIGESTLAASAPLDAWIAWLTYQTIDSFAVVLPRAFAMEHFDFYGRTLSGTPEEPARWKRAVTAANAVLGDAVGRLYAKRYFRPSWKAEVEEMTANIKTAFAARIDRLDWIAEETKAKAKAKLDALIVGVGYPDHGRDYKDLEIRPDDAFSNLFMGEYLEYCRRLDDLDQPPDRSAWWMTPQTVNALNLPVQNALNFPAAILQPPYFDPSADPAANYGGIGAVIGHEISHSFDDQGSRFDETGKLQTWWTREDLERFNAAGERLAAQFGDYEPIPDAHVDGRLTLSENIADVAGLSAAYDAWKLSLGGRPAPLIDGLTGEQRFFISFAQSWRHKHREADLRKRLLTDCHAPAEYRADTVRNLDAWYDAFDVKPGEKLYLAPEERVQVW